MFKVIPANLNNLVKWPFKFRFYLKPHSSGVFIHFESFSILGGKDKKSSYTRSLVRDQNELTYDEVRRMMGLGELESE